MKIFTDLHHSGLLYSLHLLFEKRLGYELYRPIGMDWFENNYWDIAKPYNNNINTVKQYLQIKPEFHPVDVSPTLNKITLSTPSHYEVQDLYHNYTEKAITFEQFKAMDIDIIIASIPDHYITYTDLRNKHKPKAKVICQMGNMFDEVKIMIAQGIIKNLMASTIEFPAKCHRVFYHQEQPLVDFTEPPMDKTISSFVHCLPKAEIFNDYKLAIPEAEFLSYGAGCQEGWATILSDLYAKMRRSSFVYHVKPGGDGYGWNWHSAFITGRPIITYLSDYKDKLGGVLFDENCGINLEARPFDDNVKLIKSILSDRDRLLEYCHHSYNNFRKYVDYTTDTANIINFIDSLV
jgi:hypothetical protein